MAALLIMAALIITGALLVGQAFGALADDAEVINYAGRQRMLSQQIAKTALQVAYGRRELPDTASRAGLRDAVARLRSERLALIAGDTIRRVRGALADKARALIVANEASFDALIASAGVIATSRSATEIDRALIGLGRAESAYLEYAEGVTARLSTESTRRVRQAQLFMYGIVGLVLLGLSAVGLFVLRPAVLGIRIAVERLRQANVELDIALGEARGLAKAKSDFLATMSHELRTPLNAVIGLSGLLMETHLDDRQRVFASTVNRSGDALLGLINSILDLSKIDAGKLDLELLEFDLRELVETTAETLALRAEGRNIELATYVAPTTPALVRGDPGRLRQVLLNLMGNALKFTEHGSVSVRVTTVADRVRFEVRDTGIGIPADKIGRLFQPFSQVDASTTRRYGGTGLGLDISRRLVELMDGTIGVTSVVGEGSTFHFEVPLPGTAVDTTPHHERLVGKRILIVDDTEANRLLLREIADGWHMRPTDVDSPAAALAALRSAKARGEPFDVAVLDWQMPEMDGYRLAAEIRRDAGIANTPLLLLSSFTHQAEPARVAESRFDATLSKPIRQRPLAKSLALALRAGAGSTDAPKPVAAPSATARWHGRRVLVADDNPVNVLVLKAMLERHGVRADVAADGQEVVESVMRAPYDMVFMDVYMPRVDGIAATQALREWERKTGRVRVTVVACTASSTQDDRTACEESGMDDYVSKPIARDVLEGVLMRWLPAPVAR